MLAVGAAPGGGGSDSDSHTDVGVRPLCPYPKVARYAGGDVESAASFRCE